MRGIDTQVRKNRRRIFKEVANLAYHSENLKDDVEALPYKIVDYEESEYENIYRERAIVRERIRLAMGLSLRPENQPVHLTQGLEESNIDEKYYEPPLINIIPYACHSCPTRQYRVTELCQNCLAASCQQVCPKGAISVINGRSRVDQKACIKCGKCAKACPYNAITYLERPCVAACGMDAIGKDEQGRATIDQSKCVSCGQCLVSCPFGAIVDKGQIFQVVRSIMQGDQVIAIVAPAFIGQFGKNSTPEKFTTAIKMLGFDQVVEVAVGADMCTIEEAKDFLEKVPEQQDFMATSCCPAWHAMVEKLFPGQFGNISMTLTPMVFTARLIKKKYPNCKVVFVGPCAAKKLEAIRENIRSDVDFVLTFEELQGMFEAKGVDFAAIPEGDSMREGTAAGRGFAVAGGVAKAVADLIHETHPDVEVKTAGAEGLRECRKLMTLAKAGKYKGYLLEGMACPGGCVAGAGTLLPVELAATVVGRYQKEADQTSPMDSAYRDAGENLD